MKPSFRLRWQSSPRRQSVGTRTSPSERIPSPNLCPRYPKRLDVFQVYTAHCVRASTITSLHQAGADAKQICAITKYNKRLCEPTHSYYLRDEIEFLCVVALHGLLQFCPLLKYMNVCSVMHCKEVHISMLCTWVFIIVGWKWVGVVNWLGGRIW